MSAVLLVDMGVVAEWAVTEGFGILSLSCGAHAGFVNKWANHQCLRVVLGIFMGLPTFFVDTDKA